MSTPPGAAKKRRVLWGSRQHSDPILIRWLCLVALVGCTATQPRQPWPCEHPILVSTRFTPVEQEMVELSVARWNEVLRQPLCTVAGDGTERTIMPVPKTDPRWQAALAFVGPDLVGFHEQETNNVYVPEGTRQSAFQGIVMHEIGHVLGLRHTPPPSIMAEYQGSTDDFTPNDLAECRRVGACD